MTMEASLLDGNSRSYWNNPAKLMYVITTSFNPQANSVCIQIHQTVGNVLRTLVHDDPSRSTGDTTALVDTALSIAQHAMHCSVHITLGSSPGSLVFNRDMFLNILFTVMSRSSYGGLIQTHM